MAKLIIKWESEKNSYGGAEEFGDLPDWLAPDLFILICKLLRMARNLPRDDEK